MFLNKCAPHQIHHQQCGENKKQHGHKSKYEVHEGREASGALVAGIWSPLPEARGADGTVLEEESVSF